MNRYKYYTENLLSRDLLYKKSPVKKILSPVNNSHESIYSKALGLLCNLPNLQPNEPTYLHSFKTRNSQFFFQQKLGKTIVHSSVPKSSKSLKNSFTLSTGQTQNNENMQLTGLTGIEMLCGQKPTKTRSKKFVAGFKLKKDQLLGFKVTLRKGNLYSFLDKLLNCALTKKREFSGLNLFNSKFDSKKTYLSNVKKRNEAKSSNSFSFGFSNLLLFPELENHYEIFEIIPGIQITFVQKPNKNFSIQEFLFLLHMYQIPSNMHISK